MLLQLLILLLIPNLSFAGGRHSIARNEANRVFDHRFGRFQKEQQANWQREKAAINQEITNIKQLIMNFYHEQARAKQEEQQSMEREIAKAKHLEQAIVEKMQQKVTTKKIISAAEIAKNMEETPITDVATSSNNLQFNSPLKLLDKLSAAEKTLALEQIALDLQQVPNQSHLSAALTNDLTKLSPATYAEFLAISSRIKPNIEPPPTLPTTTNPKLTNHLLGLKKLNTASLAQQRAAIKELVTSLQDLPYSYELSLEFTKDLAKAAPNLVAEFITYYNANTKGPSLPSSLRVDNLSKPDLLAEINSTKSNNPDLEIKRAKVPEKNINAEPITTKETLKILPKTKLMATKQRFKELKNPKPTITFSTITTYDFNLNTLYQIYAAPYKVTTIELKADEKIVGEPILGDLISWQINKRTSTVKGMSFEYLMIQPLRAGSSTSLTLMTNQGRLYVLNLTSLANDYMAIVRWNYAT